LRQAIILLHKSAHRPETEKQNEQNERNSQEGVKNTLKCFEWRKNRFPVKFFDKKLKNIDRFILRFQTGRAINYSLLEKQNVN